MIGFPSSAGVYEKVGCDLYEHDWQRFADTIGLRQQAIHRSGSMGTLWPHKSVQVTFLLVISSVNGLSALEGRLPVILNLSLSTLRQRHHLPVPATPSSTAQSF